MSKNDRSAVVGAIAGAAAAAGAAGAAAGGVVAVDRAARLRRAMSVEEPPPSFDHEPGDSRIVPASDGIILHVEIDTPTPETAVKNGPTVVLVHGYTLSLRSWVLQRRALVEAGYRVVAFDHRSHGQSGHSDAGNCTIDQLGRDLGAVIAECAPEGDLVLIGHSMGGMAIMAFAEQHLEIVRRRVVATAFVASSAGGHAMVTLGFGPYVGKIIGRLGPGLLGGLAKRQQFLSGLRRFGRQLEDYIVERYSFGSPVPQELVRFSADLIFSTPFDVMHDFLPAIGSFDRREVLPRFGDTEVLVINGTKDLMTPEAHSETLAELIPDADHVLVEDAGHMIMLEHPDLVTEELLALIARGMERRGHLRRPRGPRVSRVLTDIVRQRTIARALARSSAPRGAAAHDARGSGGEAS